MSSMGQSLTLHPTDCLAQAGGKPRPRGGWHAAGGGGWGSLAAELGKVSGLLGQAQGVKASVPRVLARQVGGCLSIGEPHGARPCKQWQAVESRAGWKCRQWDT